MPEEQQSDRLDDVQGWIHVALEPGEQEDGKEARRVEHRHYAYARKEQNQPSQNLAVLVAVQPAGEQRPADEKLADHGKHDDRDAHRHRDHVDLHSEAHR